MEVAVPKADWERALANMLASHDIYAPVEKQGHQDYRDLKEKDLPTIVYNRARPVSPLKTFFLPVTENVSGEAPPLKPRVIMGAPSCDIRALALLDAIYMDEDFPDPYYARNRERSFLVAMDCFHTKENCHCSAYGIDPWTDTGSDLNLSLLDQQVLITSHTEKGEELLSLMGLRSSGGPGKEDLERRESQRKEALRSLEAQVKGLPSGEESGRLLASAPKEIWARYASSCVSCGACSSICPSCSCFLLVDRPGFEKVRQQDTCQHPGFERVAGGEDPLHRLSERFRNRYMCKYVWRPEQHGLAACTGCGRCTESCIGQIDKNELIRELSN